jgi:hypothetical protein
VGENRLAAKLHSAIRQLVTALTSQNKQGIGIIFIVDYFATCFTNAIISTSEINAKKKSAFATSVERAITRTVPNSITFRKNGFAATFRNCR